MHPSLFENPITRDILVLLMISSISELEKKIWLEVLPELTDEELTQLASNLKKEVKHEQTVTEENVKKFIMALEATP